MQQLLLAVPLVRLPSFPRTRVRRRCPVATIIVFVHFSVPTPRSCVFTNTGTLSQEWRRRVRGGGDEEELEEMVVVEEEKEKER